MTATIPIADPRVSEAHALVSLRGRSLKLLALRGLVLVEGTEVDSVTLEPGLHVELAEGLPLKVRSVSVPTHALMLCGTAPGAVELSATIYSIVAESGGLRTVIGFIEGVPAHLWYSGTGLWIRISGKEAEPVYPGAKWTVLGCSLQIIQVPLQGTPDTWTDNSYVRNGLVVIARYTTVHVQRASVTAVIVGKPANLISELIRFGGIPVAWEMLSRQIWGKSIDRLALRKNFDSTIARLRSQLRELEIRDDLVRLDGAGNVEIVLYPGDRMVDQT